MSVWLVLVVAFVMVYTAGRLRTGEGRRRLLAGLGASTHNARVRAVRAREMPALVATYAAVQFGVIAYGLARVTKLWNHPIAAAAVVLILALWLAAIVIWRQRWAWAVTVAAYTVGLVEPAWHWRGAFIYSLGALMLALLVSPPMRRYVGAVRHPAVANRP